MQWYNLLKEMLANIYVKLIKRNEQSPKALISQFIYLCNLMVKTFDI